MKTRKENKETKIFDGGMLSAIAADLNHINKTYECRAGLDDEDWNEMLEHESENDGRLNKAIDNVAQRFGISKKGAVLLAHIAERNCGNGSDENDLSEFVGCSHIEFFGYQSELEDMESKGVIVRASKGYHHPFFLSRNALKSIEKDSDFTPIVMTGLTADEFFTRFRMFFSDFQNGLIDVDKLLENIHMAIELNPELEFSKKVSNSSLLTDCTPTEERFFFYLCHRRVTFGEDSVAVERLLNFTDFMEDDQLIRRVLSRERSNLQKSGLVSFSGESGFQDMDCLSLTDMVVKDFLSEVTLEKRAEKRPQDVVSHESIAPKELFYTTRVDEQMNRLTELLQSENFKTVQERLEAAGMRKGFAVLFSGGAGCGKTAGVYELARKTGRDIFAVDMSKLKSKWVGDSEKIVKNVFDIYRRLCKQSENAPILLFNEADAIFSKRFEDPEDSVDQMMNSIQNVILQQMETLDGILLATTNLAGNFCDEAFSRRFIFKVEFDKPDAETRARIWKSMIKDLSAEDAAKLGETYVFSGGNIENIARKAAVDHVLTGNRADYARLCKFCDEETLSGAGKHNRIGY